MYFEVRHFSFSCARVCRNPLTYFNGALLICWLTIRTRLKIYFGHLWSPVILISSFDSCSNWKLTRMDARFRTFLLCASRVYFYFYCRFFNLLSSTHICMQISYCNRYTIRNLNAKLIEFMFFADFVSLNLTILLIQRNCIFEAQIAAESIPSSASCVLVSNFIRRPRRSLY